MKKIFDGQALFFYHNNSHYQTTHYPHHCKKLHIIARLFASFFFSALFALLLLFPLCLNATDEMITPPTQENLSHHNLENQSKQIPSLPPQASMSPAITIDTSAPINAPSLDVANNGTPIINIVAPNAFGISDNHYIDFNVKQEGLILNNSLDPITPTELGGLISSNPHFKDQEANLILNQVTSTHTSELLGLLEIAGKEAGLIIANPNGITCAGCGFINTSNLTLTTGIISWDTNTENRVFDSQHNTPPSLELPSNPTLALKDSIASLNERLKIMVQRGHIAIETLDTRNIDTLNLLSETLKIDKALFANKLNIILGANQIGLNINENPAILLYEPITIKDNPPPQEASEPSTQTQTLFALDVAYLGGVYAKSIYLINSQATASIYNAGVMATFPSKEAFDGGFTINTAGKIIIATPNTEPTPSLALPQTSPKDSKQASQPNLSSPPHMGFYSSNTLDMQALALQNNGTIYSHNTQSLNIKDMLVNTGVMDSNTDLLIQTSKLLNQNAYIHAKDIIINAQTLHNQDKANILGDNLVINASKLENIYALLGAKNSLAIVATNIENIANIQTQSELVAREHITQGNWQGYDKARSSHRFYFFNPAIYYLHNGDKDFERTTYEDKLILSSYKPSMIISGDLLAIQATSLKNQGGSLIAPRTDLHIDDMQNNLPQAKKTIIQTGRQAGFQNYSYETTECKGWGDHLTFCIHQTKVTKHSTRFEVFDYRPAKQISDIDLKFPSVAESLETLLNKPDVMGETISGNIAPAVMAMPIAPRHRSNQSPSTSNPTPIANASNESMASFLHSAYLYERFKHRSALSQAIFLTRLEAMDSKLASDFYNSDLFLKNTLNIEVLNDFLARLEKNNLANSQLASSHALPVAYALPSWDNDSPIHSRKNPHLDTPLDTIWDLSSAYLPASWDFSFRSPLDKEENAGILANNLYMESIRFFNHSKITSESTSLYAKDLLSNQGNIQSKTLLLRSDGLLHHSGAIFAENALLNASDITMDSKISSTQASHSQSSHSQDTIAKTASIKAKNLTLEAKDNLHIAHSLITAKDKLHLKAKNILISTQELLETYQDSYQSISRQKHLGAKLEASDMMIEASSSISLNTAKLKATQNAHLLSGGDLNLLASNDLTTSLKTRYENEAGLFVSKTIKHTQEELSIEGKGNDFEAKNITLEAKGNILSIGSHYNATEALYIATQKDYLEMASTNNHNSKQTTSEEERLFGFTLDSKETTKQASHLTHNHSALNAKAITIQAQGNATLKGANLLAKENTLIEAGSFKLLDVKDTNSQNLTTKNKSFFGLFQKESGEDNKQSLVKPSTLIANTLNITTQKDISIQASNITTQKDARLLSKDGNIQILSDTNKTTQTNHYESRDFKGFSLSLKQRLSLGADFNYQESNQSSQDIQSVGSHLNIGGNLILQAGQSYPDTANTASQAPHQSTHTINVIGSTLQAKKDMQLNATAINIQSAQNTQTKDTQDIQGILNFSLNIGNAYADTYFAGKELAQAGADLLKATKDYRHIEKLYEQGKASKSALDDAKINLGFATLNVGNATLGLSTSIASAASAAASSYGTGFYASASVSLSGDETLTKETSITHNASILQANNISLKARGNINQIGSHSLAKENLVYEANAINLLASENTTQTSQTNKAIDMTMSYGSNGIGARIGGGKHRATESSSTYENTTLNAKHIAITTNKDLVLKGANVFAQDASIKSENLHIISLQDTTTKKANGGSVGIGVGNAKGLDVSLQKSTTDKEWVREASGIATQDKLTIQTKHKTQLKGSYLISSSKELSLNTQSLHFKDINNKNNQDSIALSLGISGMGGSGRSRNSGKDNNNGSINNPNPLAQTYLNGNFQHIGYTQAGKTQATLGEGEIVINGINNPQSLGTKEFKELKDLNRDVNTIEVITQDKLTHALDVNTNIDMRVFTQAGREEIGNDLHNLGTNITQIGKGLKNNIITQSFKNAYLDKDTSLVQAVQDYIRDDGLIKQIQEDKELTNSLNNLTDYDPNGVQNTLQQTANIASNNTNQNNTDKTNKGFDGEVKLYNNDPTTKGYADTLNGKNTIGFNTRTNNLVQSKGVINTIFHETTDKATHHHNEQTALNRGNTAGNIWELKNFSNAIAQRNSQRKNASNNQLASKLTTQEWNKQYANDKILQLGNALNNQSRTQNTQENGERDERGIIKSIPALKYLDPHYLIEKGGNAIIKWSKKLGKNKDDSNVKVPQRPESYSEESTNNPQTKTGEKKESKQEAKQETPQSANPPVKSESAKQGKGNNQNAKQEGKENKQEAPKNESKEDKKFGENGPQMPSKTVTPKGQQPRIDVENPAPGKRDGQIHTEIDGKKYLYDNKTKSFIDQKTKQPGPPKVQDLLKEPKVQKGIQKGLKYLGE
ncbi:hemagglutinin repeat-containing protein [Helicobacter sp. 11S02596-1]|uniref:hemagglutinin repeat-containing protein n=1 Tax=Helicobacter sp. 11S02596-1 TaxID=1476194 RepID=UPI000BA5EBE7|nr:hemagglutinin repeat-containing protein [Helicobacter sp. 11S02596-1]PAF44753.1 hypothetical protein BJI48_01835 [Helicobacter sp. 11S02596-1]